jgi:hypothetical protein
MTADDLNNHLIKEYLYRSVNWKLPPLQPRRTLDVYFYTHLESTRERDQDQIVYRYTKWSLQTKIFVVDQLWFWVLNEGMYSKPQIHATILTGLDTVISCCPQRWDSWGLSLAKDVQDLVTLKDDLLSVIYSTLLST